MICYQNYLHINSLLDTIVMELMIELVTELMTVKANYLEERELIGLTRNIPFDDRINYSAQVSDLRPSLISEYLNSVGSELYDGSLQRGVEEVGMDMHIVRGPKEYRKPVNAGLLFFNEHPENYFPYTRIEVVDKPDPTGIGMKERIFSGPLDKQLRDALSYIQNYCITEYVTKMPNQAEAVRVYNWPYRAVEEALCNAVYHKSYQIHEPVTVTITPESMEILSLPGPDRSITDESIEKKIFVSSRYRNRRIGDYLKELKMVEGRNTGIPLMLKEMEHNGSDAPRFITDRDRSFFRVILPIHPLFLEKDDKVKGDAQSTLTVHVSKRRKRDDVRKLIESFLHEKGEMSVRELAQEMGYDGPNNTIRSIVNKMIKEGTAEYLYPDKPNSRNQKIRLKG